MKKLLSLISLLLLSFPVFSQLKEVKNYYESGTLKESFSVLSNDSLVKHGLYRKFSPDGMVLEEIRYNRGAQEGKKLIRQQGNGLIQYYSYYHFNGDYLWLLFQYDTTLLTLSNVDGEKKTGTSITRLPDYRFTKALLDSLDELLKDQKVSTDSFYANKVKKLDFTLERIYMKGEGDATLARVGGYLLNKLVTLIENLPYHRDNEVVINKFYRNWFTKYQNLDADIFDSTVKKIAERITQYFLMDSIEQRFVTAYQITSKINETKPLIDQILIYDSLLAQHQQFMTDHYSRDIKYLVLYQKGILPKLDSIKKIYRPQMELKQRVLTGRRLEKGLSEYKDQFPLLNRQDSLIVQQRDATLRKFSHRFPERFKQELDLFRMQVGNYDTLYPLGVKLHAGDSILGLISRMSAQCDTLYQFDTTFNRVLPLMSEYYKNNQPNLYKTHIDPLEAQVVKFKNIVILAEKIATGKRMMEEVAFLSFNIDSLKRFDTDIQAYYRMVKDNYQKYYKNIFKQTILPKEEKVFAYRNIAHIEAKLLEGRQLISWLKSLNNQFDEMQKQVVTIDQNLDQSTKLYKKPYYQVKSKEISEIRNSYRDYKEMDQVEPRVSLGRRIITQLDFLVQHYDTIRRLDTANLRILLSLKKPYKDNFRGIYDEEVLAQENLVKNYAGLPSAQELLVQGKRLKIKLEYLKKNYDGLQQQLQNILAEHERFITLYARNKPFRVIYKKGNLVYKFYFEQYKLQKSVETSLLKGEDLELILKKINSLSHDDNLHLIQDLKIVKEPPDIRKAFGI